MVGFYHPLVLSGLLLIPPALVYYYSYHEKRSRRRALAFSKLSFAKAAQAADNKSPFKTFFTPPKKTVFILMLLTLAFLIIGLAGPHAPLETAKEGVNVVLAMDVSGSMQATDYKPNRLEVAKTSASNSYTVSGKRTLPELYYLTPVPRPPHTSVRTRRRSGENCSP